jgi:hypothetical protein
MSRNKRIIAVAAAAAVALVLYFGIKTRTPFADKRPAVGETAPAVSLADMNGTMITLAGFKGRVVLVNFWASGVPPVPTRCRDSRRYSRSMKIGVFRSSPSPWTR